MNIPSQRLTAAKSRKSKEGRDDEDGEGNTYCELALLPKRSEFKHSKPKCPTTCVQKNNSCRKDNLLLQWLGRFPSRAKKIDVVSRYFDSYWDAGNAVMRSQDYSLNEMNCPQDSFPNNICLVQPCLLGLLLEQGGLILGLLQQLNAPEDIKPSKRPSLQRPLFHIMYSSLRSQVFTRCRTKVQLQRPKKLTFPLPRTCEVFTLE